MTHDEVLQLIAPVALATASEAEEHDVYAHAARCPACSDALAEMEQVAFGLAHASVAHPPPASLRARVLGAVDSAREQALLDEPATAPRHTARAAAGEPARARRARPSLGSRIRRGWQPAMAGALAAACLALAMVVADSRSNVDSLRVRLDRVQQQRDAAQHQAAPLKASSSGAIQFTDGLQRAGGTLMTSGTRGYVVLTDVPAPPPGRSWQAWIVRPDASKPKISLDVIDGEEKVVVIPISRVGSDNTGTFAMTLEPAGGSAQPTGDPIGVGGFTLENV